MSEQSLKCYLAGHRIPVSNEFVSQQSILSHRHVVVLSKVSKEPYYADVVPIQDAILSKDDSVASLICVDEESFQTTVNRPPKRQW